LKEKSCPDRLATTSSLGIFERGITGNYVLKPWLQGVTIPESESHYSPERTSLVLPGGQALDWVSTFADKPAGEPAFLVGSTGLIELVANQANAAEVLHLRRGDRVKLLRSGDE
jgi:hypothetical protein